MNVSTLGLTKNVMSTCFQLPYTCVGEGEVALPSTGEVIALSDETFNELSKNTELMVCNDK